MRRPVLTDAADIYEYASDPQVTRYMTWHTHTHIKESIGFLESCAVAWETGQEFCWAISIKPLDKAVGAIGCRVRGRAVDFGYVLNRKVWEQGFATEAARAVVDWAMSLPGVYRMWATTDTENLASVRVLEKTGFSLESTFRKNMIRPNISNEPRDTFLFAKVRSEG